MRQKGGISTAIGLGFMITFQFVISFKKQFLENFIKQGIKHDLLTHLAFWRLKRTTYKSYAIRKHWR